MTKRCVKFSNDIINRILGVGAMKKTSETHKNTEHPTANRTAVFY